MLISRSSVYLTADFRISYLPGPRRVDDLNVQKLVPSFKFGWSALVSFAGIAKTPHGEGDWIAKQIQAIKSDAGFPELPRMLLSANSWSKSIRPARPLSFSVVGYVDRRPMAMMVSNCQDLDGNMFNPLLPELSIFETRPKEPQVLCSGDRDAVQSQEVQDLKRILIAKEQPRHIHALLAKVNRAAAQRSINQTISKQCVTGHLLPSGSAELIPHEINDQSEYMPGFVKRHLLANGVYGFNCRCDITGNPLAPKWVGMTAKVQGRGKKAVVLTIHSIRNVEEPLSQGSPTNTGVFWKYAEANDPPFVTFQIHHQ